MLKQVIVMRTDLNMRKGKMMAQAGHSVMGWLRNRHAGDGLFQITAEELQWMSGLSTKIGLGINSEEGLLKIAEHAQNAGVPCYVVTDAGVTEFGGVPTRTCLALGPALAAEIDAITGDLKLL